MDAYGRRKGGCAGKVGFIQKYIYASTSVCMMKIRRLSWGKDENNGNYVFPHRRQMRERRWMFVCRLNIFCHEYFEGHTFL